jgi:hypothetical protein
MAATKTAVRLFTCETYAQDDFNEACRTEELLPHGCESLQRVGLRFEKDCWTTAGFVVMYSPWDDIGYSIFFAGQIAQGSLPYAAGRFRLVCTGRL